MKDLRAPTLFLSIVILSYLSEVSVGEAFWTKILYVPSDTTIEFKLKSIFSFSNEDTPVTSRLELSLPVEISLNGLVEDWQRYTFGVKTRRPRYPTLSRPGRSLKGDGERNTSNSSDYHLFHPWGERAALIPYLLDTLESVGISGKSCLQRAICEIHEDSLGDYGLLGEIFLLIFSVSKSPIAKSKYLLEFLDAEELGRRKKCGKFYKSCKASIFRFQKLF